MWRPYNYYSTSSKFLFISTLLSYEKPRKTHLLQAVGYKGLKLACQGLCPGEWLTLRVKEIFDMCGVLGKTLLIQLTMVEAVNEQS